jgi:hypothetical protein
MCLGRQFVHSHDKVEAAYLLEDFKSELDDLGDVCRSEGTNNHRNYIAAREYPL